MIPEFVGRLPVMTSLDPLSRNDLVRVLQEPKNALVRQYQQMFAFDGAKIEFDQDALLSIADRALRRETGVRALRSILEELLLDVMFELPENGDGTTFRVSKPAVEGQEPIARSRKRRKTAG